MGHPAHYHLFRNTIHSLESLGCKVLVLIKKKDILEELISKSGFEYININPEGRTDNKIGIITSLLKREWEFFKVVRKFKPEIMVGTSAEITHIGKLMNIPSIVVNEDDAEVVPMFAKVAYPFASTILAPTCTSTGKWKGKKTSYNSLHELAYLHPDHFKANPEHAEPFLSRGKFFIIRFAKLTAHHDDGRSGISDLLAEKIIDILKPHGQVIISSERPLSSALEVYREALDPNHMHSLLSFADLYIGDSQTMAAEAAVLGTPSVRFNDFVGEIAYLDELEHLFGLTTGISARSPEKLLTFLTEFVSRDQIKPEYESKRQVLLEQRFNSADFFTWFIFNYPQSKSLSDSNSNYYETKVLRKN